MKIGKLFLVYKKYIVWFSLIQFMTFQFHLLLIWNVQKLVDFYFLVNILPFPICCSCYCYLSKLFSRKETKTTHPGLRITFFAKLIFIHYLVIKCFSPLKTKCMSSSFIIPNTVYLQYHFHVNVGNKLFSYFTVGKNFSTLNVELLGQLFDLETQSHNSI